MRSRPTSLSAACKDSCVTSCTYVCSAVATSTGSVEQNLPSTLSTSQGNAAVKISLLSRVWYDWTVRSTQPFISACSNVLYHPSRPLKLTSVEMYKGYDVCRGYNRLEERRVGKRCLCQSR